MEYRKCSKCNIEKQESLDNFYKRSTGKLDTICKECVKEKAVSRAREKGVGPRNTVSEEHKKKVKSECQKRYYKKVGKEKAKKWRLSNKEKLREYYKEYRKNNRDKYSLTYRLRKNRTSLSKLAKQFKVEIKEIYDKSHYMSKKYSCNFQVDHIIPLNNPDVCGLHVPWNLQIMFKRLNGTKSNKFDGTYNNESWIIDGK
jgi:hypothetical protein